MTEPHCTSYHFDSGTRRKHGSAVRPRRVSDDDILVAARRCLLQQGAAVSLDTIAHCVGVSGPAVLKRFGTKEQLVTRALLSDAPPDLSGGPEAGPLRPQLVAILLRSRSS